MQNSKTEQSTRRSITPVRTVGDSTITPAARSNPPSRNSQPLRKISRLLLRSMCGGLSGLALQLLVAEQFEFADGLEVLRPPRGALHVDQRRQVQAKAPNAPYIELHGIGQQFVVTATPGDFAQQVDPAERCGEGE